MKVKYFIPYLFLLPSLLVFSTFMWFPLLFAFFISFHKWKIAGAPEFTGFLNYTRILNDSTFAAALKNTIVYTIGTVPLALFIAFVLALALNRKLKGIAFFRGAYFFPVVVSYVVVSLIWQWMYQTDTGIINHFLSLAGFKPVNWLNNPKIALWAIILMSVWKTLGYYMVIFLAGLQGIPSYTYEAAKIDGVNRWQKTFKITIPLMKPTILFCIVIAMINSFKVFDQIYIMTKGGPGESTLVLVQYIYQAAFETLNMGYGCSIGIVFFIMVLFLTIFQFKIFKTEELY